MLFLQINSLNYNNSFIQSILNFSSICALISCVKNTLGPEQNAKIKNNWTNFFSLQMIGVASFFNQTFPWKGLSLIFELRRVLVVWTSPLSLCTLITFRKSPQSCDSKEFLIWKLLMNHIVEAQLCGDKLPMKWVLWCPKHYLEICPNTTLVL